MSVKPLLDKESDTTALKHIHHSDAAFEQLFKSHFAILCTYCQLNYSFEPDLAKEVVHAGFVKLWENRDSINPELSVKGYLYKTISNICLDHLKHSKIKKQHQQYVMQHGVQHTALQDLDAADIKMLKAAIDKAVADLPHQMRRIFELSRYDGFKYAQIASLLNISVKTVETQMGRALSKLRQKLARYAPLICIFFLQ